jgi:hypothetical protein
LSLMSRILPSITTQNTNLHAPGGIRTCNSSKRSAAGPFLRQLFFFNSRPHQNFLNSLLLCLYFVLTYCFPCLDCPVFCL